MPFSAPAELRMFIFNPALLIAVYPTTHILYINHAQYILSVRHSRIPSKNI
jgi:hypothetical protein